MIYEQFSVIAVPFPFTDKYASKLRPAVVISSALNFNKKTEHSVMAMITSARNKSWPLDVTIEDLKVSGLPHPSVIRMKLFTLDHRLVVKKLGKLSSADQKSLVRHLKDLIFD